MGWRLAEEVAWARPEQPGPEWWTLLDIAQDANDDTRQGWPGHEYLMARTKRSRSTVDRRLKALADAGLIKVAQKAAPGRRVIYEIPILPAGPVDNLPAGPVDNPATCVTNADARSGGQRVSDGGQRVSKTSQRVSTDPSAAASGNVTTLQVIASGSVTHPPSIHPSLPPSEINVLTSPVQLEGARARLGQDPFSDNGDRPSPRTAEETAAEYQRQADALGEWMRQHPETEAAS
jgi:hypothetical protein